MSEEPLAGPRIARGPLLQVHPADREQRIPVPALQELEVPVRLRNVGTEPLSLLLSATAPWVETPAPELHLEPGAEGVAVYRVAPLVLQPGSFAFTGILQGPQLLGDREEVRIRLEVADPASLQVRDRADGLTRARAWDTAWIELEVRRSDGHPFYLAAVSADPWPHWLLKSELRRTPEATLVRLQAQAPGRGPARVAELTFAAAEPGIEPATHTVRLSRQPGPVLIWDPETIDTVTREKLVRDDPEWTEQALTLPDLLPGDSVGASFRIRNAGDQTAEARVLVDSIDPRRGWLEAGFGPAADPAAIPELSILPGQAATIRVRLEAPLPLDRWEKDASGRIRRARTPARELTWPGALVRVEAENTPLALTRKATASVLGALQPVPLDSRVLPAAIDLGLSLFGAGLVYVAGWTLLGDYHFARLAEPVMGWLQARFYSLAGGLALVLGWLLYALLLAGCQGLYGTTPGKAYAGMELRRPDGSPAPPLVCAARGFLTALLLPLLCLFAALGRRAQNPLDRWLNTRVVRVVSLWED